MHVLVETMNVKLEDALEKLSLTFGGISLCLALINKLSFNFLETFT